jgi:hypothetical protein
MGCVFYRDLFGGWRWEFHAEGGEVRDSRQSFDSREECVEDAIKAGLDVRPAPPISNLPIDKIGNGKSALSGAPVLSDSPEDTESRQQLRLFAGDVQDTSDPPVAR